MSQVVSVPTGARAFGLAPFSPSSSAASVKVSGIRGRSFLHLRCQAKAGRSWPDPNYRPSEAESQSLWGDAAASQGTAAPSTTNAGQDTRYSAWDAATGGGGTPWAATTTASSSPSPITQTASWATPSSTTSSSTSTSATNAPENSVRTGSQRASPVAPAAWKESPSSAGGEWLSKQISLAAANKQEQGEGQGKASTFTEVRRRRYTLPTVTSSVQYITPFSPSPPPPQETAAENSTNNGTAPAAETPGVGADGRPLNELELLDLKYADRWRNWKPRAPLPEREPEPERSVLDTPMYDKNGRRLNELEVLDVVYADRWKNWKPRHGRGPNPSEGEASATKEASSPSAWRSSSSSNWNANAAGSQSQGNWNAGYQTGGMQDQRPGAWNSPASQAAGTTGGPWFGGSPVEAQSPTAGTAPGAPWFGGQTPQAQNVQSPVEPAAGTPAGSPWFGGQTASQAQNVQSPGDAQSPTATGGPWFGGQAQAQSPVAGSPFSQGGEANWNTNYQTGGNQDQRPRTWNSAAPPTANQDGKPLNELEQLRQKYSHIWDEPVKQQDAGGWPRGGHNPQDGNRKPFNTYWSKSTGTVASKPRPPPGPAWIRAFGNGADIPGVITEEEMRKARDPNRPEP